MQPSEALNLLKQVVELFRGTAEEHRQLQRALEAMQKLVEDKDSPKPKE